MACMTGITCVLRWERHGEAFGCGGLVIIARPRCTSIEWSGSAAQKVLGRDFLSMTPTSRKDGVAAVEEELSFGGSACR